MIGKYHRGRRVDGVWVFGGVDENGKCFLVPVENRTEDTLVTIIKEWIHEDSIIISDCWKAYHRLKYTF